MFGIVNGTREVQEIEITKQNAKDLLNQLKEKDKQTHSSSYELRTALLVASEGGISTYEAYTYPTLIPNDQVFNMVKVPENWIYERQAWHEKVLKEEFLNASRLSLALGDEQPIIHALRGNTGTGKTSFLKKSLQYTQAIAESNADLTGTVNPDRFKKIIRDQLTVNGRPAVSHYQTHVESVYLTRSFAYRLYESDLSVVIDQRLEAPRTISMLIEFGKTYNKRLRIVDFDSPLELSLSVVMSRRPGSDDPIPPFDVIAQGFSDNRTYRRQIIQRALSSLEVDSYTLIARGEAGAQKIVAKVQNGQLIIQKGAEDLYQKVVNPDQAQSVQALAQLEINEANIERILLQLPGEYRELSRQNFSNYKGLKIKDMVNLHAGLT